MWEGTRACMRGVSDVVRWLSMRAGMVCSQEGGRSVSIQAPGPQENELTRVSAHHLLIHTWMQEREKGRRKEKIYVQSFPCPPPYTLRR